VKVTTWAVLASLVITVMLGVLLAAGFGAAPPAYGCSGEPSAVHATPNPAPTPPAATHRDSYLVAVRMGWAVS
jgi:hypothetical protein